VDLPRTTYELGGHTEDEIATVVRPGVVDRGRRLRVPARAVTRGTIGVCVVGVGAWGSYYCEIARRAAPRVRLFVCGRDGERTARVARSVRADGMFTDLEEAAADPRVQGLALILPHDEHRRAVELVVGLGKDALVEKPIATTLADADAMIACAEARGVRLMVGEDMHFRPTVGEAARRIERGDIGEPLYLVAHGGGVFRPRGWKADPLRAGGGVLMDVGVHYVRALRLLLGSPSWVAASRAMQLDTHARVEESVQLMFSSDAGWQSQMLLSWTTTRGHLPDLMVMGEHGTLHLWPGTPLIDFYPIAQRPLSALLDYVRPHWLQSALRSPTQQRIRVRLRDAEGTGHERCFREFVASIEEERAPVTAGADARRDLEIVLRAYEALASGTRTSL
jgi:predicted dehydrogenase